MASRVVPDDESMDCDFFPDLQNREGFSQELISGYDILHLKLDPVASLVFVMVKCYLLAALP
jgi:hypothetical protein